MLDVPVTNYQPKKIEREGEAKRPAAKKGMASSTCKAPGEGQHAACWWESLEDKTLQVWNNHKMKILAKNQNTKEGQYIIMGKGM